MVDRLDPGQVIVISGNVTANAGTGTFTTSVTNQPVEVTLATEKDVLREVLAVLQELRLIEELREQVR